MTRSPSRNKHVTTTTTTHLRVDVISDRSDVRLRAVVLELEDAWSSHLYSHLWTHLVHRLDEFLGLRRITLREHHHPADQVHLKTTALVSTKTDTSSTR